MTIVPTKKSTELCEVANAWTSKESVFRMSDSSECQLQQWFYPSETKANKHFFHVLFDSTNQFFLSESLDQHTRGLTLSKWNPVTRSLLNRLYPGDTSMSSPLNVTWNLNEMFTHIKEPLVIFDHVSNNGEFLVD